MGSVKLEVGPKVNSPEALEYIRLTIPILHYPY